MKRDFLTNLPSKIITNILSRLPLRAISISKCVCKPWLHLLEADDFVNTHLSKSAPALAVLTSIRNSTPISCKLFQFTDDQENLDRHDLHFTPLTNFHLPRPHPAEIRGSANGLLLLSTAPEAHLVCNPITRECAEVRFPEELIHPYPKVLRFPEKLGDNIYSYPPTVCYGFGASRISGQYKVVRVYQGSVIVHGKRRTIPESECHVHTLGTRSWRRVEPGFLFELPILTSCVFLNGNLHWVVTDAEGRLWISCFDLETERFSFFSAPPVDDQGSFELIPGMSALEGCLCLCNHTAGGDETMIWVMKEYGVEESWTKEYVMKLNEDDVDSEGFYLDIEGFELVYPIKVFEDGDILLLLEDHLLFYYSIRSGTPQEIAIFDGGFVNAILLTPSFVSLKRLGMESVVLL